MAQEFQHRPDVRSALEQMGDEGVPRVWQLACLVMPLRATAAAMAVSRKRGDWTQAVRYRANPTIRRRIAAALSATAANRLRNSGFRPIDRRRGSTCACR